MTAKIKPSKSGAVAGAVAKGLGHEVDELSILGESVYRVGFNPSKALAAESPRFGVERAWFHKARHMFAAYPSADPDGHGLAVAWKAANDALEKVTDAEVARTSQWLRQTVGDVPAANSRAALLAAVRKQLDDDMPPLGRLVSAKPPRSTAFEGIGELACQVDEVLAAQRTFEQACLYAEPASIRAAGGTLQQAITKHGRTGGLDGKQRERCRRAVETVIRSFERGEATPAGANAVAAFHAAYRALDPADEFVAVYRRLQAKLNDDDLARIGDVVGRMSPADKIPRGEAADVAQNRMNSVKGLVGEIIGRKGPYRELYEEQRKRAAEFVNGPAGRTWSILFARTPIRGLNSKGVLALFYDDAIMLVDEGRTKVALVFTAQFKAGDFASLKVFSQLDNDEVRAGLGKLLVDGKLYDIDRTVLDAERAIVTTRLGVMDETVPSWLGVPASPSATAAAIGTKDVRFVPMPARAKDLDAMATFLLRATKKIAAD